MKVIRRLTIPGRREYESSTWEIELTSEDVFMPERTKPQKVLQELCRQAQARVLACAVADGCMSNEELSLRMQGFIGPAPKWLEDISKEKE